MHPGSLCPARGSCVCWHCPGRLPGGGVQVGHTQMGKASEHPSLHPSQGCANSDVVRFSEPTFFFSRNVFFPASRVNSEVQLML